MGVFVPWVLALSGATANPCQGLREYDGITAVVTQQFYDRSFRGLDWPSRTASYRRKVHCDADASAVAAAVNGLLSELHASHTGVYTRTQLEYWALESIFSPDLGAFKIPVSGIWPQREGARWYARYILSGSAAEKAGVRSGDALISIDGRPFDPLGFKANSPNRLTLSSDGREQHTVPLTPVVESVQQSFLDATHAQRSLLPSGSHRVGYFHLWTGTNRLFLEAINAAIAQFEKAQLDGLIIDFRGGYGGASLDYLAALEASAPLRKVPKVLLIDDGVRSGKEWVAAVIKHEKIATLVGSRTAGAFLGGRANHLFDDKYFVYVASAAFVPPDVGPIEGIGIEPDVAVQPCLKYCHGVDTQLDAALGLLRDRIGTAAPSVPSAQWSSSVGDQGNEPVRRPTRALHAATHA